MMRVIFTKLARQELEDAVRFYELEHAELGRKFKEEVRKAETQGVKHKGSGRELRV